MKIKYLGHACFLIITGDGTRIITDPYQAGNGINYAPVNEAADIVVMTHDHHSDHWNAAAIKGKPEVVKGSGIKKVKGIEFNGVATYHDEAKGAQRGTNIVFCFSVDSMKLCHAGDLGHVLTAGQILQIDKVDVLFLPVGGFYTIDASAAGKVVDQIKPRIVIPMHFKTAKCDYPISGVEDFLRGKSNMKRLDTSELDLSVKELPANTQVLVLKHAL